MSFPERFFITLSFAFVAFLGFSPAHADDPEFSPDTIKAHLSFLADDLLEGREAGTRGYDLAAKYVETQFKALGLKPAGDNGSYYQQVQLQESSLIKDSVTFSISSPDGTKTFQNAQDIIVRSDHLETDQAIEAEVVFAGFGVEAPELGHNDYEGLDVRGKIVAIFARTPSDFPSELGAHFGSADEKAIAAAKHGAIGILTLYTPTREQVFPFERALTFTYQPRMVWVGPDGVAFSAAPEIQIWATMGPDAAPALFAGTGVDFAVLQQEADTGSPKGFPLNVSVKIARQSTHEIVSSPNVAAILPGSDPGLADEYVIISAHLDHIGINEAVEGDVINNGAIDNATGIATMLEVARVFAENPARPRRSVLFLAVTAEEKGLLGAEYFANNPTVPADSIVGNVNLDASLLLFNFSDVIAFGASHSDLGDTVALAADKMGVLLSPDPMPEQGIFTRSDHYAFVKKGVPAVFLILGFGEAPDGKVGSQEFGNYFSNHYHKPSDDLNLPIDYVAGAKFARLNWLIANEIANADARPRWYEDDFFGNQFAPSLEKAVMQAPPAGGK